MANKKLKQVYEREIKELAHKAVIERYRDAIRITDSVYIDILHAMRDEIDSILANNKNEE
jgi:hypothetical protein